MAQAQAEVDNRREQTATIRSFQHPSDLGPYFISMNFYDYRTWVGSRKSEHSEDNTIDPARRIFNADRTSVNDQIKKKGSFATIKLPIPADLTDSFRTNWEETELGAFAGIVGDIYAAAGNIFSESEKEGATGDSVAGIVLNASKGAMKAVGRQLISGSVIGNVFDLALGTAVNQNLTVLFRGPTLKTHQFRWRLAPQNQEESRTINNIIGILKRAQHASQLTAESASVLRYPSECLIQFVSPSSSNGTFLYPLRPCILEGVNINYAPNGGPSFHHGTDAPTAVEITVSFKETSYYTRESFDNEQEYGYDGLKFADLSRSSDDTEIQYEAEPTPPPEATPPTPEEEERQQERIPSELSNLPTGPTGLPVLPYFSFRG